MSCILNETRHSKRPQNARLYARSYGQLSFSFNREYSSTQTVVFGSGRDTRLGEQKINLTADSWLQHISCEKLHSNTKSRANSQHTRTFCASVLIIRKQNGRPRIVGKLYIYPTKLYATVSNKKVFYSSYTSVIYNYNSSSDRFILSLFLYVVVSIVTASTGICNSRCFT